MYQSDKKAKEAFVKEQREIIEVVKLLFRGVRSDSDLDKEYQRSLRLGNSNADLLIIDYYNAFKENESLIKENLDKRALFEKLESYVNKYKLDQLYEKQQ